MPCVLFVLVLFTCVGVQAQATYVAPEKLDLLWYVERPSSGTVFNFGNEIFRLLGSWQAKEVSEQRAAPGHVQVVALWQEAKGGVLPFRVVCDLSVVKACRDSFLFTVGVKMGEDAPGAANQLVKVIMSVLNLPTHPSILGHK